MTLPNNQTPHSCKITMGYLTVFAGITLQTSMAIDLFGAFVLFIGLIVIAYSYSLEN